MVMPEVWLRGPIPEIDPVLMPSAHALIQASEDLARATAGLSVAQVWQKPGGAASIGFHLRHIAASLDRLLTYAGGQVLSLAQMHELAEEGQPGNPTAGAAALVAHAQTRIQLTLEAYRAIDRATLFTARGVGRRQLPTTVFGLLAHAAEHTMRHAGQVITTVKVVKVMGLD